MPRNALSFDRSRKILANPTTIITFGKYKEESVGDVLKHDASYLLWAVENVEFFDVEPYLLDMIIESKEEQNFDYYGDYEEAWCEPSDDPGSPRY